MFREGKLPEPDQVDGIGPLWKPVTIERWAKREWWGHTALAETVESTGLTILRNVKLDGARVPASDK
jgi:hypothetical protein